LFYGGGESKSYQFRQMERTNPEILVATPGRLIDIIQSYTLDVSNVEFFVLDEGDRMLDMGF
jgi:superfamily II DNA/RNA helicase